MPLTRALVVAMIMRHSSRAARDSPRHTMIIASGHKMGSKLFDGVAHDLFVRALGFTCVSCGFLAHGCFDPRGPEDDAAVEADLKDSFDGYLLSRPPPSAAIAFVLTNIQPSILEHLGDREVRILSVVRYPVARAISSVIYHSQDPPPRNEAWLTDHAWYTAWSRPLITDFLQIHDPTLLRNISPMLDAPNLTHQTLLRRVDKQTAMVLDVAAHWSFHWKFLSSILAHQLDQISRSRRRTWVVSAPLEWFQRDFDATIREAVGVLVGGPDAAPVSAVCHASAKRSPAVATRNPLLRDHMSGVHAPSETKRALAHFAMTHPTIGPMFANLTLLMRTVFQAQTAGNRAALSGRRGSCLTAWRAERCLP